MSTGRPTFSGDSEVPYDYDDEDMDDDYNEDNELDNQNQDYRDFDDPNDPDDPIDRFQIVVNGKIKPTKHGTEIISFVVNLALFKLVCIVNIPEEGKLEAPVYLKFRLRRRNS